jgi:hypothetical protein
MPITKGRARESRKRPQSKDMVFEEEEKRQRTGKAPVRHPEKDRSTDRPFSIFLHRQRTALFFKHHVNSRLISAKPSRWFSNTPPTRG